MSSETFMDQSLYVTLARIQHARDHERPARVPAPEENIAAELEPLADTLTQVWHALAPIMRAEQYAALEGAIADLRGLVVALRT